MPEVPQWKQQEGSGEGATRSGAERNAWQGFLEPERPSLRERHPPLQPAAGRGASASTL